MTQKSMTLSKVIAECLTYIGLSILLVWTLSGFAYGRKFKGEEITTVPLKCMHDVHIIDFHKPCKLDSKNPNMAHCDDVIIRFACVEYGKSSTP